ncbi:MAG: TonB family protein [Hyphomonadaceae bacterium]
MRKLFAIIGIFGLTAVAATAQSAPPAHSEFGIGPYYARMSRDEAVATAPSAHWREMSLKFGYVAGAPSVRIGDRSFEPYLDFQSNRVVNMVFEHEEFEVTAEQCRDDMRKTVEAVERIFGRLDGPPTRMEDRGPFLSTEHTEIGSEIRYQGASFLNGRAYAYANQQTEHYLEVRSELAPRLTTDDRYIVQACRIFVDLRFLPLAAPGGPPTQEELQRAPVLENPNWIIRPTGRSFARNYPAAALQSHIEGRVVLDCVIAVNGQPRCVVFEETPAGAGFGDAGLAIVVDFALDPNEDEGSTIGRRVQIPIAFRLGD